MSTEVPSTLSEDKKYFLAVDPGGKTRKHSVGVALFTAEKDYPLAYLPGQMTSDGFLDWLETQNPNVFTGIVCEDYINFGFKKSAQAWNRNETSQLIGAIRAYGRRHNINVVLQMSNILPMAEKHFQVKMPKNHDDSHKISAYLHGAEFLLREGLKPSQLERELYASGEATHQ